MTVTRSNSKVKLLGFGLTNPGYHLTQISFYDYYFAPEYFAPKGDVFGLGVVLLELVIGCMINAPDDIFKKGGLKDTLKYLADIEIKCRY
ncbi:unnamed protein product, partial [Prunus brigantina]